MDIERVKEIYDKMCQLYIPESVNILDGVFGDTIDIPKRKVMFPPLPNGTFDSQQAEAGFLKHDCAVLTAFRATRAKEENSLVNRFMAAEMDSLGLHYIRVDGCFREAREAEASHEDSYLVYNQDSHNALTFFAQLYNLSEKYEQDSFLYKAAGLNRTAYLIATNADARSIDGDVKRAGKLYLDLPPVGPYTDLDKGRFTFVPEPEPERQQIEKLSKVAVTTPKTIRVTKKRFIKPEANNIILSTDGYVKIGRYIIGKWSKLASEPTMHFRPSVNVPSVVYDADLNNGRYIRAERKMDLRQAIAEACKRGITGKIKKITSKHL